MKIKTRQWMRRHRIQQLDNVQFSAYPIQENDERNPNELGHDGRPLLHIQCDCCGKHTKFSDENPYEDSGWTRTDCGDWPDPPRYNPNFAQDDLFEVDLCAECSKEHDLAEFENLPRTGCEWCWKRMPLDKLVQIPSIKDGPHPEVDEMVCRECSTKIKRCSKCDKLHWKDDFAADRKSADGLAYTCKHCQKAARKSPEARRRDAERKRQARRDANRPG